MGGVSSYFGSGQVLEWPIDSWAKVYFGCCRVCFGGIRSYPSFFWSLGGYLFEFFCENLGLAKRIKRSAVWAFINIVPCPCSCGCCGCFFWIQQIQGWASTIWMWPCSATWPMPCGSRRSGPRPTSRRDCMCTLEDILASSRWKKLEPFWRCQEKSGQIFHVFFPVLKDPLLVAHTFHGDPQWYPSFLEESLDEPGVSPFRSRHQHAAAPRHPSAQPLLPRLSGGPGAGSGHRKRHRRTAAGGDWCSRGRDQTDEPQGPLFALLQVAVIFFLVFSRMRSEGSRFTWGSGGEAVFAKFCVCVRNRRQPSATVRNRRQPFVCPP